MTIQLKDILALTIPERVQLVEDIWDSILEDPQEIPLTAAQKREVDRRRRAHKQDPAAAKPWTEIRERLKRRK